MSAKDLSTEPICTAGSHHVVIIGAGIAGLAVASQLKGQNVDVTIYEGRATQEYEIATGTALNMGTVAMSVLKKSDPTLHEKIKSKCSDVGPDPVIHLADGSAGALPLWNVNVNRKSGKMWPDERGWERACIVKRRDLLGALHSRVKELNITVHYKKVFERYEMSNDGMLAVVHFADGSSAVGVAVLGCDGVHSKVRKQMMESEGRAWKAEPQYSWVFGSFDGDWRSNFGLSAEVHPSPNKIVVGCGAGPRAMWIFGTEDHLEWGAIHPRGLAHGTSTGDASGSLGAAQSADRSPSQQGRGLWVTLAELHEAYGTGQFGELANVLPEPGDVLEKAASLQAYATHLVPDAGFWSRGRVMLLGDAAHAIPNVVALGASLALEDAHRVGVELGHALGTQSQQSSDSETIEKAFKLSEQKRRPRVESVRSDALRRQTSLLSGSWLQYKLTHIAFNVILYGLNMPPKSMQDELQDSLPGELPPDASASLQCCMM